MEQRTFHRIVSTPEILGGKPRIRGTRLSVAFIVELFASGASKQDILKAYPQLTADDLDEALDYPPPAA
jgi:uncharacterized protein (DUF433 family)